MGKTYDNVGRTLAAVSVMRYSELRNLIDPDSVVVVATRQAVWTECSTAFPRDLLRKREDLKTADVNTVANYAVISATANLDMSGEKPASYVDRFKIPEAELKKQCVPLDRGLWRMSRYRDFLRERRKLLAEGRTSSSACRESHHGHQATQG